MLAFQNNSLWCLWKWFILVTCVHVYLCVVMWTRIQMPMDARRGLVPWAGVTGVSCLVRVLGLELMSSRRVASMLNYWAAPAPQDFSDSWGRRTVTSPEATVLFDVSFFCIHVLITLTHPTLSCTRSPLSTRTVFLLTLLRSLHKGCAEEALCRCLLNELVHCTSLLHPGWRVS